MTARNYSKLTIIAEQNTKEKEFWLDKLSGDIEKSSYPYDNPHKTGASPSMETVEFSLKENIFAKLSQLSKGSAVKLHMILTAGITVLMEKYTAHRDILMGAPIYKQEKEIDFINTILVLRNRLDGATTFKELLKQVRQNIVEASANQNYPLEILPL
ncbi:MAG: non-ribosomal peptide synthetase, partial [bacterium]|nr:non-ribosomal peptide synthetase [bacterium]